MNEVLIIVHCSDSGFGNAIQINEWHKQRGFSMIGYHFVILNGNITPKKHHALFDGTIETGRPLDDDLDFEFDEIGAHALGYNKKSIGICLIGKSGQFTENQLRNLKFIIKFLRGQFGKIKVIQHSDVESKKQFCAGLTKMQINELNNIY